MLVSAPYPDSIREDADRLLQDPAMVKVETPHDDNQIEQHFYEVDDARRFEAAAHLLRHFRPESALVFCNTRAACADRKSVVEGQSVSVRVDPGGRRIITKKKKKQ